MFPQMYISYPTNILLIKDVEVIELPSIGSISIPWEPRQWSRSAGPSGPSPQIRALERHAIWWTSASSRLHRVLARTRASGRGICVRAEFASAATDTRPLMFEMHEFVGRAIEWQNATHSQATMTLPYNQVPNPACHIWGTGDRHWRRLWRMLGPSATWPSNRSWPAATCED